MKFNENWLREWSNPAIARDELLEQITLAGLEVDDVEPVAGEFSGVVVGRVVECGQHPNADKLRVTKVDVGSGELLNIVCGAPNCREGLVVACAKVGAVLPGDFKIKPAKLRGEPSEGMLCSYSELGISDDHDGIIELPQDVPLGQDIRDYLKLDDVTVEISLTPNRADCLGMMGIARDVAVLNNMSMQNIEMPEVASTISDVLPVHVSSPEACPRYLARVVRHINPKAPTPLWMKEKLRRCGIRSLGAVVDITNYVLLELGHPMHAFDLSEIQGGIDVRFAKQGEQLTLLNENTVTLSTETLVIADHEKPLAMAGIMGGDKSGVTDETQDVLLEAAFFAPLAIAGKARHYGLHTDASHRYERGVDAELQYRAMARATALLVEICGGQVGPVIDVTSAAHLPKLAKIVLRRTKLDSLIGYVIPDATVTDILTRLGCKVAVSTGQWSVVAPSWRFDMEIEEDLIEEVARVYGYNNIPNTPILANLVMGPQSETTLTIDRVKNVLVDRGFQEAITYSFVDPKVQSLFHPNEAALALPNPISVEMSAMRLSLWSGLLTSVVYNQNRQQTRVRLFESGLRFVPDANAEAGVRQEMMLAGVITGQLYEEHWEMPNRSVDFFDLKGDLEAILDMAGLLADVDFVPSKHPALHPGQSAEIRHGDVVIGNIGVLHPMVEKQLGLNGRTIVFEVLWETIAQRVLPQATEISRFPANRRDIAIVVKESVAASEVLKECKRVADSLLIGVNLFDVYRGKGISEGYKSLAIALLLQDGTRTLEDEEIAIVVNRCIAALEMRFQATLRE